MKPQHLILALIVNIGAGTNWVGAKIVVEHFPPLFSVSLRFAVIAVLLAGFAKIFRGQMRNIFLIAFTLGVLQFGFMFVALDRSADVSSLAITNQLYVPFAVILAVLFLGERVGWRRITAMALAFGGVIVMSFDPFLFSQLDALGLVVLAALALSVASILMRRLKGVRVFEMQFWLAAISAPQLFVLSLILEDGQWQALTGSAMIGYAAIGYGLIAGGLFFHAGWYYLLRRYPVGTVGPFMLLMPVIGVLSGVGYYGDVLTLQMILGGALTLSGVAIITLRGGVGGEVDFDKQPAVPVVDAETDARPSPQTPAGEGR